LGQYCSDNAYVLGRSPSSRNGLFGVRSCGSPFRILGLVCAGAGDASGDFGFSYIFVSTGILTLRCDVDLCNIPGLFGLDRAVLEPVCETTEASEGAKLLNEAMRFRSVGFLERAGLVFSWTELAAWERAWECTVESSRRWRSRNDAKRLIREGSLEVKENADWGSVIGIGGIGGSGGGGSGFWRKAMGGFGRFLRLDSRFRRAGLMALDCFMVVVRMGDGGLDLWEGSCRGGR
jgi:hypothetical protein